MSAQYLNDSYFAASNGNLVLIDPQSGYPNQGACFVMFFSHSCETCKHVMPHFDALSSRIRGIQLAKMDMSQGQQTFQISQQTGTPLVSVPTMFLFIGGYAQPYVGNTDVDSMQQFLQDSLRNSGHQQQFAPPPRQQMPPPQQLPGPIGGGMGSMQPPQHGGRGRGGGERESGRRGPPRQPEPSGYSGPYPTYEQAYPGANYRDMSRN